MKKIAIILSLLVLGIISTTTIYGQEFALSIAPQEYHIVSKKGQTITLPYTLSNVGDPTVVQLRAYVLSQKDSQGTFDITPASKNEQTKKVIFATNNPDITLEKPFLFQSQKTYPFTLSIHLPEDIDEKDYYFMLAVASEEQKGFRTSSSIQINGSLGSVIYISVTENGALLKVPELINFETKLDRILHLTIGDYTIVNSGEPIPVILSLVNGGKNLFTTDGAVIYESLFSKKMSDTEIDNRIVKLEQDSKFQKEGTVFPLVRTTLLANMQKTLNVSYDPVCTKDVKACKTEHTVVLPGHFIGAYRIAPQIKTDTVEMPTITSEKYIVFFPYYLFLLLGIGLLGLSLNLGKK
jgi:hypothetical protein